MVFLNPSILLGLIAASIPILIHLLNFRKLQKVEFSTLSFLKELQKSKIKKIKIKQWLLLLLRTLIIIFIVFAFARPTIENVNFTGTTSSAKSSMAFIIDNSFSMSYVSDDGSNLNRSKKTAKQIISELQNGDEYIFIISKDSTIITTNRENALTIVDDLKITVVSDLIIDKLELAKEVLNESHNINKEIFLFSDFQKNTFITNLADSGKIDMFDDGIKLYSFDFSIKNSANYSVENLTLENSIIELKKPLTFSTTVNNYSNNIVENLTASLFLNNKRVAQQNVNLNPNEESNIKFETSLNNTGLFEAKVELEEDNILHDNTSYLNFMVPAKIKILIMYDQMSDIIFLEAALNSSSTSGQIEVTKINAAQSSNYTLNDFNLIFIVSTEDKIFAEVGKYLTKGGKILFIPPAITTTSELVQVQKSIGLPDIQTFIDTNPNTKNYTEFGDIDYEHPIFKNLFAIKTKKQIESPNIFRYIKFKESIKVHSIIRLLDDSIYLGEYSFGKGKAVYFNSAAILSWSNLPIKGIFAPLLSRIVYYLTSTNDQQETYTVGETIPININQITFPLIDIALPESSDKINLQNNNGEILNYSNTLSPGSYKFFNNNKLFSYAAVNINPIESDLTKIEANKMQKHYSQLFGDNYLLFDSNENYSSQIKQARYGIELWKYLIMIALLLALLEMYIARSTKKDLMKLN